MRKPVPDKYRYDIPLQVRWRLINTMGRNYEQLCVTHSFMDLVIEVGDRLLQEYGFLKKPAYDAAQQTNNPVLNHFLCCEDELAVDFLQACFEGRWNCGGQPNVDAVNRILEEENIGYELTPVVEIPVDRPPRYPGGPKPKAFQITPPRIIRKDEKAVHQEIVRPALHLLADPRFATANAEFLTGMEKLRHGDWADAITSCGAAIESVLKTICTAKGWTYDPHKDTCSKLLDICRENGLFHPFYRPILEGTATIRNKVGDAHGKGPNPEYVATKDLAEHMVHTCCSNILLLVSLARL